MLVGVCTNNLGYQRPFKAVNKNTFSKEILWFPTHHGCLHVTHLRLMRLHKNQPGYIESTMWPLKSHSHNLPEPQFLNCNKKENDSSQGFTVDGIKYCMLRALCKQKKSSSNIGYYYFKVFWKLIIQRNTMMNHVAMFCKKLLELLSFHFYRPRFSSLYQ